MSPAAENAEPPSERGAPALPSAAAPGPMSGRRGGERSGAEQPPGSVPGAPGRRGAERPQDIGPEPRRHPRPWPRPARPAAPDPLPPSGGRSAAPQGASGGPGPSRDSVQPGLSPLQGWGFPVGNLLRCLAMGGGSCLAPATCPRWGLFLPSGVAAGRLR